MRTMVYGQIAPLLPDMSDDDLLTTIERVVELLQERGWSARGTLAFVSPAQEEYSIAEPTP